MAAEPKDTRTAIFVISGTQGAGKTTVAARLAARFERAVHVQADTLQQMIVFGRRWPEPHQRDASRPNDDEAIRQLRLRLRNMCLLARSFCEAGFTAVLDDIVVGDRVAHLLDELTGADFYFIMLVPDNATVRERERQRGTELWREWEWLTDSIHATTPRIGLWLNTSNQAPEQTVDEIMSRAWDEALVRPAAAGAAR